MLLHAPYPLIGQKTTGRWRKRISHFELVMSYYIWQQWESHRPPHSPLSLPKALRVQHVSGQKNIKITFQIKIHSFLPPDRAKLTPLNHESALLIPFRVKSYRREQSLSALP